MFSANREENHFFIFNMISGSSNGAANSMVENKK
jgi:hypothetical protein